MLRTIMAGIGLIAVSSRGWLGEAGDGAPAAAVVWVGMALSGRQRPDSALPGRTLVGACS